MELIIGLAIAAILFAYFFFKKPPVSEQVDLQEPMMSVEEATAVVHELESAGYYKFADTEKLPALKEDLINSLATSGVLSTINDDETHVPEDYRYYSINGDILFEENAFIEQLQEMQPFFHKIDAELKITNHVWETDVNDTLNHHISINGKRYIIFQNFNDYGPGEVVQRFAEIVNDQLMLQQKAERLFLINEDDDGAAVFLEDEQFNILHRAIKDERWKPLEVKDWCRVFDIDPESYKGQVGYTGHF